MSTIINSSPGTATAATNGLSPIAKSLQNQREFFKSGTSKDADFRLTQLKKLRAAIVKYEKKIMTALKADLNKPAFEAYGTEVGFVLGELDHTIKHVKKWMRPNKVKTALFHAIGSSRIQHDPYGAVLIIAPWNYPFQLLIAPLIGAISAGNTVVLKPSELAPHTSDVCVEMIKETFDEHYIDIFEGGVPVSQELLAQKWDYIFFTGSTAVGKIVYQAAAKHLTPVTLELGGKSPCIVDKDTDIKVTAQRIAWGKLLNAGQTCIAPDYLLVQEEVKDELIEQLKKSIKKFYGKNPMKSKNYCRIISSKHLERLGALLENTNVVHGGEIDAETKYISPTLIDGVTDNDPVMQSEIFGPILPIMTYRNINEAIDYVNSHPKPLALYVFTKNKKLSKKVLKETSSGGACVNDTISHIASTEMPFGGVGASGMGGYHGKFSFEAFSHAKSVMERSQMIDPPLRYAPYRMNLGTLKFLLKRLM